jgi:hypothetical protein
MAGKKRKKPTARAHLSLVPAAAQLDTTLDDDLRTHELILFVRCLFGKPGLQIADYAGTLSSTVIQTAKRGAQKHGTARTVQAA